MPAGRPSKYSPAYCEEVVSFCEQGYSLTAFAGEIGVDRASITRWMDEHEAFRIAAHRAKAKRARWWEEQARNVAQEGGTGGRSTMVIFGLKNHAPEDYSDLTKHQVSGSLAITQLPDAALDERIVAELMATGLSEEAARAFVVKKAEG